MQDALKYAMHYIASKKTFGTTPVGERGHKFTLLYDFLKMPARASFAVTALTLFSIFDQERHLIISFHVSQAERVQTRPGSSLGPGNRRGQEQTSQFRSEADLPQNLPGLLEPASMQTLEELLAKLEFENELYRVRMTMNIESALPARGHGTGSADSGIEEEACEEDGAEDETLLDLVLEMEQDYGL